MNEDIPIIYLVVGAGLALYLGYEIDRRRTKLRAIFNTFDREESQIAKALEMLVESGELKPYAPAQSG